MASATIHEVPTPEREMLADLKLSDEQTQGKPVLPPERVELARHWLARVLIADEVWEAHLALLSDLYRGRFTSPLPRLLLHGEVDIPPDTAEGFRHCQALPADEAQALTEIGPAVYPPERLAQLLLNPVALWDLADRIDYWLPEYWRPAIRQIGRELIAKHPELDFPIPGVDDVPNNPKHGEERP